MLRSLSAVALMVTLAAPAFADGTYKLNGENTKIEFTGTKPEGKHDGGFKNVTGTATVSGSTMTINVNIDCESLYSDDPKLTNHLKGDDFFGVKTNPKSTFKSTKIEKKDSIYVVEGDLTLCGKTQRISFPAEIQTGDTFVLKAMFKINRKDFGMTYGDGKIDDAVTIRVNTEAKK